MVRLRQIVHDRTVLGFCEGVVVGVAGEGRAELSYVELVEACDNPPVDVLQAVFGVEAVNGEWESG